MQRYLKILEFRFLVLQKLQKQNWKNEIQITKLPEIDDVNAIVVNSKLIYLWYKRLKTELQ